MKISLVVLALTASVLAIPGRGPAVGPTLTVTATVTVAPEPVKTTAGPKVTVGAREAAERAKADKALKELQALEKLPFDTVSYDKLPNKDYKYSDAWRSFDAARIQPDGKVEKAPKKLFKRTPGGIYITTDIYWGGQKGYKVQPFNTCIVLNAPWLYSISSFGPDQGTRCIFYQRRDCNGSSGQATIWYPGNPNLTSHYYANWNDRIGSWRCWEDWSTGPAPTTNIETPQPTRGPASPVVSPRPPTPSP